MSKQTMSEYLRGLDQFPGKFTTADRDRLLVLIEERGEDLDVLVSNLSEEDQRLAWLIGFAVAAIHDAQD